MPPADRIAGRIEAVLAVIYLIFNEGYASSNGGDLIRHDLCAEALRLGRELNALLSEDAQHVPAAGRAEAMGLLTLMILHHARRHARIGSMGELVVLEEQDRSLWDQSEISEGLALPMLEQLIHEDSLRDYFPLYAARADLLRRASRYGEASLAYAEAIQRCHNQSERNFLRMRLDATKALR